MKAMKFKGFIKMNILLMTFQIMLHSEGYMQ